MSEFARLEDKLTKLKGRVRASGERRKLRGDSAAERLAALVGEIDETILPRRLTLIIDGGTLVHLAVANRRLQAMVGPAPDVKGAEDIVDAALANADDDAVGALQKVLKRAFTDVGVVEVSATRLKSNFGSEVGVPANALARVWNVAKAQGSDLPQAELLGDFLKKMGDRAFAWLRIDGELVADQGGDAVRLGTLGEQAAVFLDGYFGKFDSLFPKDAMSCATVVMPGRNAGAALLYIEYAEASAFIAAEPAKVALLASHWQAQVAE